MSYEDIIDKILDYKTWFSTFYTIHEQKYRRLISLNIDRETNESLLTSLYQEAEQVRNKIHELEALLPNDK